MMSISVHTLMNSDVVTSDPRESLSKVISKMALNELHEIPIVDDNKTLLGYFGFDVLSRKKHVPLYTKIEKLMVAPPKISGASSVNEAAKTMLETGFRALPVTDDEDRLEGVISRTDIIKVVPDYDDLGKEPAKDVMTPDPRVLDLQDGLEKALALMTELDELCAPVVDENGRAAGGVLIEDIGSGLWRNEEGVNPGDLVGENNKIMIDVSSYLKPVPMVKEDDTLRFVCAEMSRINPYLAIVCNDRQEPMGVITQYDVLKKVVKYEPTEGLYVDITGLDVNDPFVYSSMVSKIERFVKKIGEYRWIKPYNLNFHVHIYHKEGGRRKWSLRGKLRSDRGLFFVKGGGWDLLQCFDEVLYELNERIKAVKPRNHVAKGI